jgi:hypothetical protein
VPRIMVSFDFNGAHHKSVVGPIDPVGHLLMLSAAVDRADPGREHDALVTAINWPLWACDEDVRMVAWQVHARCREVISYPAAQEHQTGACWCLRMAFEAAAAHGAEYLVHLADDVLLLTHTVGQLVHALGPADYLGSGWGSPQTANTQVFVCRVSKFIDFGTRLFLVNPVEFAGCGLLLEGYLWHKMAARGLRVVIGEEWAPGRLYFHSHDAAEFLRKAGELKSRSSV